MRTIKQNKLCMNNASKKCLDMGLGMPRPQKQHQMNVTMISGWLNFNIFKLKKFMAITETEAGKPNSEVPDITVESRRTGKNLVSIEITNSRGQNYALKNSVIVMNKYNFKEAFVYNYNSKTWMKVYKDSTYSVDSYSNILKIELNKFKLK